MTASSLKTIYIGFHDGQRVGDTPTFQYEPVPRKEWLTHSQMMNIVNRLIIERNRLIEAELAKNNHKRSEYNGAWPQ